MMQLQSSKSTPILMVISFTIYSLVFEAMVWGIFGYAVFILGFSGWWMLFALMLSGAQLQPAKWNELLTGKVILQNQSATSHRSAGDGDT